MTWIAVALWALGVVADYRQVAEAAEFEYGRPLELGESLGFIACATLWPITVVINELRELS